MNTTRSTLCLLMTAFLAWGACSADGEGDEDDGGGEAVVGASSVCLIKLTSSYECSDGGSDHSDPGTWTCRSDFSSLEECKSVMVGATDYADGCIFDTTATEHTWLSGGCEDYPNGPSGTKPGGSGNGGGGNGGATGNTSSSTGSSGSGA